MQKQQSDLKANRMNSCGGSAPEGSPCTPADDAGKRICKKRANEQEALGAGAEE